MAFGKGKILLVLGAGLVALCCGATGSLAAGKVPPGNRNAEQPAIPGASVRRTAATKSNFEAKYEKIRDLLARDAGLREKIRSAASAYGIAPIHIVGALVGEHTYNVDAYDRLQSYYVKAMSYAGERFRFEHDGESVSDFVERPQFDKCRGVTASRALWTCRENVWNAEFRGKRVDGKSFPNNRFAAVFFQPFYAGQTFGLGQLSPLTALMNVDKVAQVSGLKKISAADASGVYAAIMDPDSTLAYMAASIRADIDDYRSIAGFDISANPGLTATLYNVGDAARRARQLAAENKRRAGNGEAAKLPEENYYGWLVNSKESELRGIIGG